MEIGIFRPPRPYVENDNGVDNQIPDACRCRGNPFWAFVDNMLGLESERYPSSTGELDWQLDAVARRDRRMAELNKPPGPPSVTLGEPAQEAVGHIRESHPGEIHLCWARDGLEPASLR
jgi:hypothetical protein